MTHSVSGRPQPDEYAPYAQSDIDCVAGGDAVTVLADQAESVLAVLRPLTEKQVSGLRYAPGKWTIKEVLGHLIDDERIFAYRALCVAREDRRPLPGFDENEYVRGADFEERQWGSLLAEYVMVRHATVAFFGGLAPRAWLHRGVVNGYEASVRGLAFHVAGHELHHLRVLRERYLPLLEATATGHP
jgi:hypothetical protein